MVQLSAYLQLLRPTHWYKNLVVFLALFFSGSLLNLELMYLALLAFASLSLISSAGYIINDLVDARKDQLHPEKRFRPLAAGTASPAWSVLLACILLAGGTAMAWFLGVEFLFWAVIIFLLMMLYSFWLKQILFADIIAIAVLFVIRAISGASAIGAYISPWLVLCPFFLSLFLAVGKRHSEVHLLKDKAVQLRKVLQSYTHELTSSLMGVSLALLVISYALYSFLSQHPNLLYTLPFALFVMFRFYYLIMSGSAIARQPELVVGDRAMTIGLALWIIITVLVIYG